MEACPCERSYSCCWLYYWVFLSSDRPCQVYYKVRQVSLQRTTDFFFITKCDKCYYKVRQVLQSGTIITKCDRTGLHCVLILFHGGRIWLQIYFTKLRMNIKGKKTKFIDFYLRFRIGTLFHTSNVILQGLYCVTITEHELPVMSHEKYIKPTNYRTNKQKQNKI